MFIPIYDINPLDHVRRPYVTWGLIVLNIAIYVLGQHGFSGAASEASLLCCGAIPAVVTGQAVLPETQVDEDTVARHWMTDVFEPVIEAIPPELSEKLEPAEVFHEVLEHRWFLSEAA